MAKQSDFGTVDPGSIPSLAFYIYKVRRYTNGSAPDGRTDGQTNGWSNMQWESSRAGALCGLWILMSSEYSIANFNFYVAAYIFLSNYNLDSIDTISLTLNNGGNCRKQKSVALSVRPSVRPSVRCQHNVRLSVRPSVRPCGANIMFSSVRPSVRAVPT